MDGTGVSKSIEDANEDQENSGDTVRRCQCPQPGAQDIVLQIGDELQLHHQPQQQHRQQEQQHHQNQQTDFIFKVTDVIRGPGMLQTHGTTSSQPRWFWRLTRHFSTTSGDSSPKQRQHYVFSQQQDSRSTQRQHYVFSQQQDSRSTQRQHNVLSQQQDSRSRSRGVDKLEQAIDLEISQDHTEESLSGQDVSSKYGHSEKEGGDDCIPHAAPPISSSNPKIQLHDEMMNMSESPNPLTNAAGELAKPRQEEHQNVSSNMSEPDSPNPPNNAEGKLATPHQDEHQNASSNRSEPETSLTNALANAARRSTPPLPDVQQNTSSNRYSDTNPPPANIRPSRRSNTDPPVANIRPNRFSDQTNTPPPANLAGIASHHRVAFSSTGELFTYDAQRTGSDEEPQPNVQDNQELAEADNNVYYLDDMGYVYCVLDEQNDLGVDYYIEPEEDGSSPVDPGCYVADFNDMDASGGDQIILDDKEGVQGVIPADFERQPMSPETSVDADYPMADTMSWSMMPTLVKCPNCDQNVLTDPQFAIGSAQFVMGCFICFFGGCLGCCLMPCLMPRFHDVVHVCPVCEEPIGRLRRI